jgi:hypothetical protein
MGEADPPQGPTIPTLGITNALGLGLVERLKSGEALTADFYAATARGTVYR